MAEFFGDPWTPGQPTQPLVPGFDQLSQQVGAFMDDPRARSALLSFGLSMMSPPSSFGGNFASDVARGIGAAGETVDRIEGQDLKQQEAESKQDLRAATATAAEQRATIAGQRAGMSAERLALMSQNEQGRRERNELNARVRLSNLYQQYVKDIAKRNENARLMPGGRVEPVLPMAEWIKTNPALKDLGLVPDTPDVSTEGPLTPPAAASSPASGSPASPAVRDPLEGRTATGPDGKKVIRRNGKWEPI